MRRQIAAERGDPHGGSAAKKGRRAAVFAQWLVDTYGVPYLKSGSGNVRAHSWSKLCCATVVSRQPATVAAQ